LIRRSTYFFGILLFCALAVSCGKAENIGNSADGEDRTEKQADRFAGTDPIDIHIYESGGDTKQNSAQEDVKEADTDDKAVQADNFSYIQKENTLKGDKDLKENENAAEAAQGEI
jgi:hypothetical protein